ncbi:unnamed protein product [Peronospora farinosa]|uniref:PH domain-containing protein n=1 Tax=Peronospora farinosa TaxID=134698 RepID=A0AAV0UNS4_9STRA|nr:unnamed protein product [Peronospora farinosa]
MTCAGYLILQNRHPVFVEINTGILICSLDIDKYDETSLPSLELRRMAKFDIHSTCASSQKMEEGKRKQPDDEKEPQENEPRKRQRLLQLSGFMIEVLDQDEELDEPLLPYSFQVNTYKIHLQPDGSSCSTLNDSLILSATDRDAKELWVQHIKLWNRYGWRDTVHVAATRTDLEKLQERLQKHSNSIFMGANSRYSSDKTFGCERNSAITMYGGRSSYNVQSSCVTKCRTKRRFYRTSVPSLFAPPS